MSHNRSFHPHPFHTHIVVLLLSTPPLTFPSKKPGRLCFTSAGSIPTALRRPCCQTQTWAERTATGVQHSVHSWVQQRERAAFRHALLRGWQTLLRFGGKLMRLWTRSSGVALAVAVALLSNYKRRRCDIELLMLVLCCSGQLQLSRVCLGAVHTTHTHNALLKASHSCTLGQWLLYIQQEQHTRTIVSPLAPSPAGCRSIKIVKRGLAVCCAFESLQRSTKFP